MSLRRLLTVSAAAIALALAAGPAAAQTTYTWTGGGSDGNWSNPANWGGTAPASSPTGTRVNLAGTANTTTTIDAAYGNTLQVLGLSFAPGAGPFAVNGGGPVLEVGAEGVVYGTAALGGGSADQTVAAPVRLGADQMWVNYGTGRLKFTGPVDTNGHALTLGKTPSTGEGLWWIDLLGPVTGSGRVTAVGRATMRGANTYSGGTTIADQAWLVVDSAANLGAGRVNLNNRGTLTLEAAVDSTLAGPLVVTNTGGNDYGGIQVNAAGATLRFQPGGLQGGGDLDISGFGTKVLTGNNTFSGTLSTGTGGRLELLDAGGGASIAAKSYSIYQTTFHVGPGATLDQAAGAASRPSIGIGGSGRVEIEQSQHLSGVTMGYAEAATNNPTLVAAPGVVLTLDNGFVGYHGTVSAVLAGTSGGTFFTKGDDAAGTLTVTGLSTFTGPVRVESGVLSVDSLKPTGQASALGAGGEVRLWRTANLTSTLRYTGPTTATDRPLQVLGSDSLDKPSILEVTDPAATLTWTGPVRIDYNNVVSKLQKSGSGALVIASAGNSFYLAGTGGGLGSVRAAGGTLAVTGSLEALVTVESGATAAGKLVGTNTSNYRVHAGSGATALTAKAGATIRAGMGSSADVLGVDGVQFDAGSTFAVTVDGGATPTASEIKASGNGGPVSFSPVASTGTITLRLEKGPGADFVPYQPVTVEIARGGIYKRINNAYNAFTYDPNEWAVVTSGFDIVPGSFSLFTTESGSVLNAQFTPVPEPAAVLLVGAAAVGLAARRARRSRDR